jgi:hypothetical protein
MMIKIVIAALTALASPALAQDQPGNRGQPGNQEQPGSVERIETPQGTLTIVRPRPRAQPSVPRSHVNPDPVPPPPQTQFLTDQLGMECWRRPC